MFSKKEFHDWAKENVVLFASIMTQIEDREDDALLRDYGFRGFPSLAVLDHSGDAITKKMGRDLASMKTTVSSAKDYQVLKQKVEAGQDVDQVQWYFARMGLGMLSLTEAKTALAELELDEKQADKADAMILGLELEQILGKIRGAGRDAQARQDATNEAAESIYAFFKAGRRPAKDSSLEGFYMSLLMTGAEKNDDGKAFLAAYPLVKKQQEERMAQLEKAKKRYAGNEMYLGRIEKMLSDAKNRITELDAKAEKYQKS